MIYERQALYPAKPTFLDEWQSSHPLGLTSPRILHSVSGRSALWSLPRI